MIEGTYLRDIMEGPEACVVVLLWTRDASRVDRCQLLVHARCLILLRFPVYCLIIDVMKETSVHAD